MLYIPVENDYNTPVSLKRSLSDPEIYFPSSVRHSLIVAVNGIMPPDSSSSPSSSHRINGGNEKTLGSCQLSIHESRVDKVQRSAAAGETLQIDINVIQPTPNISPSHSLRSISGESKDLDPEANFAGIPFLIVPPSPVRIRRVSFSDTSIDNAEEEDEMISLAEIAPEISVTEDVDEMQKPGSSSTTKRRSRCVRQASLQVDTTIRYFGDQQQSTLRK